METFVYKRVPAPCPCCKVKPKVVRGAKVAFRCANSECTRSRFVQPLGLWGTREVIDWPRTFLRWLSYLAQAVLFAGLIAIWFFLIVVWWAVSNASVP